MTPKWTNSLRLSRLIPNNASLFIVRGIEWYFNDKYVPAIKDFTEALRLEPRSSGALLRSRKGAAPRIKSLRMPLPTSRKRSGSTTC